MDSLESNKNYAVLIDADNISPSYSESIFEELAKYGTPTIKRVYGNWSSELLKNWEKKILDLALSARQQFNYTKGKNAVDMALVIDAMDILYSKNVEGICIVSSDSDYIPITIRLKEANIHVIGMGEQKTPEPFANACNKFIYLENLRQEREEIPNQDYKSVRKKTTTLDSSIKFLIRNIIEEHSGEDGWLNLAELGNQLIKQKPNFDTRTYGHQKLSSFIKSNATLQKTLNIIYENDIKTWFVKLK